MTHAIVLVEAERTALPSPGGRLADVGEVFSKHDLDSLFSIGE